MSPNSFSLVLVGWLAAVTCACGDPPPELAPPAASSATAPDEVDPNMLLEGPSKLFGVPMPMRSSVLINTSASGKAHVPFPFHKVNNYFRARLESDRIEVGPRQTIFRDARIKGGNPEEKFYVVIKRTSQTAEVTFRRETTAVPVGDGSGEDEALASTEEQEPEPPPRPPSSTKDGPPGPPPSASAHEH